jgi:hypothetical protein
MDKEVQKNLIQMSFEYNRNKVEEELEKMNIALGVLLDKITGDTNKFFNVE